MKPLLAQDSKRLIVMDDNVKYRGLFSFVLTRVVCLFILYGLAAYGLFSAALHPKVIQLFQRIDNVSPEVIFSAVITVSLFIAVGFIYSKVKK